MAMKTTLADSWIQVVSEQGDRAVLRVVSTSDTTDGNALSLAFAEINKDYEIINSVPLIIRHVSGIMKLDIAQELIVFAKCRS